MTEQQTFDLNYSLIESPQMHRKTLGNIDINIFELDTERRGALVSVSQQCDGDAEGS